MSQSPRLPENNTSKTIQSSSQAKAPLSAPMLLIFTALDTTWRAFVPTLGGTFAGIGLDAWLGIAPFGVIICLTIGVVLSTLLIIRQLINVRKPIR